MRNSTNAAGHRQGFALAGSMGEALEMAGDPNAVAVPQTHRMWPGNPDETFFWH
ncbi:MAG: hypothetical protein AB8B62_07745 [Roseobacter sp.]